MANYWEDRVARAQEAITNRNAKKIENQFRKYYIDAAQHVIEEFEKVYNKLLASMEEGKEITPADLYKLDKYWQAQAQIRKELNKLGEKQIATLTRNFETQFFEVYYSFALPGVEAFNTVSNEAVNQMINQIWVADGKTYSQRVWNNTARLLETLNEELVSVVATGKRTTDLKRKLQERFDVSYRRADTLVRTELTHIQTQAAKQRYQDYGIKEVEVLVDVDAKTCDECKALVGKRFKVGATPPLPVHPNERCCLIPVIE